MKHPLDEIKVFKKVDTGLYEKVDKLQQDLPALTWSEGNYLLQELNYLNNQILICMIRDGTKFIS